MQAVRGEVVMKADKLQAAGREILVSSKNKVARRLVWCHCTVPIDSQRLLSFTISQSLPILVIHTLLDNNP